MGEMHTYAEVLASLADVARAKGLVRVHVGSDSGNTYDFELGPAPASHAQATTLLSLSQPIGAPDDTKRARVAKYRDALEGAHVTGEYPELSDYQLTPGDL